MKKQPTPDYRCKDCANCDIDPLEKCGVCRINGCRIDNPEQEQCSAYFKETRTLKQIIKEE